MSRHVWRSEHTRSEMPLARFGSAGDALIYVPSSGGDVGEFESYGMDETCRRWTGAGFLQVFAIDGFARRHLWNDGLPAEERIRAYARYERYVIEEVLPWVGERAGTGPPTILGCSYGAFVAANVLLKRPGQVRGACGLGGVYGLWHRLDDYHDEEVYFHTPLEYLPGLSDATILGEIRGTEGLAMFAAAHDEWLDSTRRMVELMRRKKLPCSIDVWPAPANHHERWWREQLQVFLERRFAGRT